MAGGGHVNGKKKSRNPLKGLFGGKKKKGATTETIDNESQGGQETALDVVFKKKQLIHNGGDSSSSSVGDQSTSRPQHHKKADETRAVAATTAPCQRQSSGLTSRTYVGESSGVLLAPPPRIIAHLTDETTRSAAAANDKAVIRNAAKREKVGGNTSARFTSLAARSIDSMDGEGGDQGSDTARPRLTKNSATRSISTDEEGGQASYTTRPRLMKNSATRSISTDEEMGQGSDAASLMRNSATRSISTDEEKDQGVPTPCKPQMVRSSATRAISSSADDGSDDADRDVLPPLSNSQRNRASSMDDVRRSLTASLNSAYSSGSISPVSGGRRTKIKQEWRYDANAVSQLTMQLTSKSARHLAAHEILSGSRGRSAYSIGINDTSTSASEETPLYTTTDDDFDDSSDMSSAGKYSYGEAIPEVQNSFRSSSGKGGGDVDDDNEVSINISGVSASLATSSRSHSQRSPSRSRRSASGGRSKSKGNVRTKSKHKMRRRSSLEAQNKSTSWQNVISPFVADLVFRSVVTRARSETTSVNFVPYACEAAALFVDLSGYSRITAAIAHRGAHVMSAVVNAYLEQLLQIIHRYGGDVIKFAGDAVLVVWAGDVGNDTELELNILCASKCALELERRAGCYPVEGTGMAFQIHSAVCCGMLESEIFDAPSHVHMQRLYHAVSGQCLIDISELVDLASAGQIAISEDALDHLGPKAKGMEIPDVIGAQLLLSMELSPGLEEEMDRHIRKSRVERKQRREESNCLESDFIHASVLAMLSGGGLAPTQIAQMRNLCVLFIAMTSSGNSVNWLLEVQGILDRHHCPVIQIIDDDKGTHVVAAVNLCESVPEAAVLGLDACAELVKRQIGCAIGVAKGSTFCGVTGSRVACRWDITGPPPVRAARLMQYALAQNAEVAIDASLLSDPMAASRMELLDSEVEIKGSPEPCSIYCLSGSRLNSVFRVMEFVAGPAKSRCVDNLHRFISRGRSRCAVILTGAEFSGKTLICQRAAAKCGLVPFLHVCDETAGLAQLARTIATWYSYCHDQPNVQQQAQLVSSHMNGKRWTKAHDECIQLVNDAVTAGLKVCFVIERIQHLDSFSMSLLRACLQREGGTVGQRSSIQRVDESNRKLFLLSGTDSEATSAVSDASTRSLLDGGASKPKGKVVFLGIHSLLYNNKTAQELVDDITRASRTFQVRIMIVGESSRDELRSFLREYKDVDADDRWLRCHAESSGHALEYFLSRADALQQIAARQSAARSRLLLREEMYSRKMAHQELTSTLALYIPQGCMEKCRQYAVNQISAKAAMASSQLLDDLPPLFQLLAKVLAVASKKSLFSLPKPAIYKTMKTLYAGLDSERFDRVLSEMQEMYLLKQATVGDDMVEITFHCRVLADVALDCCTPNQIEVIAHVLLDKLELFCFHSFQVPLALASLCNDIGGAELEAQAQEYWRQAHAQFLEESRGWILSNGSTVSERDIWLERMYDLISLAGYEPMQVLGETLEVPIFQVPGGGQLAPPEISHLKVFVAPLSFGPLGQTLTVISRNLYLSYGAQSRGDTLAAEQIVKSLDAAMERYIQQAQVLETFLTEKELETSEKRRMKEKFLLLTLCSAVSSPDEAFAKAKIFLYQFLRKFVRPRFERLRVLIAEKLNLLYKSPVFVEECRDPALQAAIAALQNPQKLCWQEKTEDALMAMAVLNWQPKPVPGCDFLPQSHTQSICQIRDKVLKQLDTSTSDSAQQEDELANMLSYRNTFEDFQAFLVTTALIYRDDYIRTHSVAAPAAAAPKTQALQSIMANLAAFANQVAEMTDQEQQPSNASGLSSAAQPSNSASSLLSSMPNHTVTRPPFMGGIAEAVEEKHGNDDDRDSDWVSFGEQRESSDTLSEEEDEGGKHHVGKEGTGDNLGISGTSYGTETGSGDYSSSGTEDYSEDVSASASERVAVDNQHQHASVSRPEEVTALDLIMTHSEVPSEDASAPSSNPGAASIPGETLATSKANCDEDDQESSGSDSAVSSADYGDFDNPYEAFIAMMASLRAVASEQGREKLFIPHLPPQDFIPHYPPSRKYYDTHYAVVEGEHVFLQEEEEIVFGDKSDSDVAEANALHKTTFQVSPSSLDEAEIVLGAAVGESEGEEDGNELVHQYDEDSVTSSDISAEEEDNETDDSIVDRPLRTLASDKEKLDNAGATVKISGDDLWDSGEDDGKAKTRFGAGNTADAILLLCDPLVGTNRPRRRYPNGAPRGRRKGQRKPRQSGVGESSSNSQHSPPPPHVHVPPQQPTRQMHAANGGLQTSTSREPTPSRTEAMKADKYAGTQRRIAIPQAAGAVGRHEGSKKRPVEHNDGEGRKLPSAAGPSLDCSIESQWSSSRGRAISGMQTSVASFGIGGEGSSSRVPDSINSSGKYSLQNSNTSVASGGMIGAPFPNDIASEGKGVSDRLNSSTSSRGNRSGSRSRKADDRMSSAGKYDYGEAVPEVQNSFTSSVPEDGLDLSEIDEDSIALSSAGKYEYGDAIPEVQNSFTSQASAADDVAEAVDESMSSAGKYDYGEAIPEVQNSFTSRASTEGFWGGSMSSAGKYDYGEAIPEVQNSFSSRASEAADRSGAAIDGSMSSAGKYDYGEAIPEVQNSFTSRKSESNPSAATAIDESLSSAGKYDSGVAIPEVQNSFTSRASSGNLAEALIVDDESMESAETYDYGEAVPDVQNSVTSAVPELELDLSEIDEDSDAFDSAGNWGKVIREAHNSLRTTANPALAALSKNNNSLMAAAASDEHASGLASLVVWV